ncbi:MAG: PEP-CTERM sorting domain-containing protein [Deltaproteobacteria bacterium]|nr:PEP-CTERM sorting domain-containing protein [Deltaproteobacteria bacterium]
MRRSGSLALAVGLFVAGSSQATIVATGGGPGLSARGELQAESQDPLVIWEHESYDDSTSDPAGNGSVGGGGSDSVTPGFSVADGEATVVNTTAVANYRYSFFHDGNGDLANGTISLYAYSSVEINESYFLDVDPNDGFEPFAMTSSRATAIDFMDLDVSGTDYVFWFDGAVRNDNAQIGFSLPYFFFMADITGGGFAFLGLYQDETPNDYAETQFTDSLTLLAGHQYRLGIGAATDFLCTDTPYATQCPAEDPENEISGPQPPGVYQQSGMAHVTFTLQAVPEPSSALLIGAGLALIAARRRG